MVLALQAIQPASHIASICAPRHELHSNDTINEAETLAHTCKVNHKRQKPCLLMSSAKGPQAIKASM
jgi:hypothetical protein